MPGPNGEVYAVKSQIGKEVTAGTSVAATRIMYFQEPVLQDESETMFHDFPTGTRDQTLEATSGVKVISGRVVQPVSADENLELLNIGLNGTPTITTPGGGTNTRDHTFIPGIPASATLELDDGAREWEGAGIRATSLRFAGNVREGNTLTAELFGMDLTAAALTGALTGRQPTFYNGRETKLYIGAFGADPTGFAAVPGFLINWDVSFNMNLGRKYTANNTDVASAIPLGVVGAEATFTFEAINAQALTQFTNHRNATKLAIRLEFGNNATIETTLKRTLWLDLPGAWRSKDLGGTDETTRTYEFRWQYVRDATMGYPFRVVARCSRTAAFA
jgi:hypothetical protein